MVAAVRSAFPNFTFHVDCNAAYTLADADLFRKLDRYRLAMIEQPLADDGMSLINHADLQKTIETPVCLDESVQSLSVVQAAIRLKSCRVVNIKMARVGGLTASRDIQALCAEHGIPCWIGGMLESAIGGAVCAELATLPNFTYPGDIFPPHTSTRTTSASRKSSSAAPAKSRPRWSGHPARARPRSTEAVDSGARDTQGMNGNERPARRARHNAGGTGAAGARG